MEYYKIATIDNELYHHGVKGMKWGVIRSKVTKAYGDAKKSIGTRKREKILKKKSQIAEDNDAQKKIIKEGVKVRSALKSERLTTQHEKDAIDRKIALNKHWTKWGQRKDQDKSFRMNARIKEIEDAEVGNEAAIATAVNKLNINKQKMSKLDAKYEKIGRRYLGQ